jgi:predicted transposase/invertase (TIGR01784 family)
MADAKNKNTQAQVYMDPFTDYGFKKLFGEEDSKVYLIDFLNSIFSGFIPHISELTYSKNEHLGNKQIDRNAVFDLYCKSPDGNSFIIELQKIKQDYFKQRSLFYSTFALQEQAKKGKWDFNLKPIYCIGILNFNLDNNDKKYITKAKILDIETHQTVIEELNFAFIECQKFTKNISANSSKQDKWLYVLSHLSTLQDMPKELSDKLFEEFFAKANILKLSSKERAKYNASITYYRDLYNIEAQNFAKGMEKGMEKGIEKGIEKGKLEVVKNLKKSGVLTLEQIEQASGLTADEVKNIN